MKTEKSPRRRTGPRGKQASGDLVELTLDDSRRIQRGHVVGDGILVSAGHERAGAGVARAHHMAQLVGDGALDCLWVLGIRNLDEDHLVIWVGRALHVAVWVGLEDDGDGVIVCLGRLNFL